MSIHVVKKDELPELVTQWVKTALADVEELEVTTRQGEFIIKKTPRRRRGAPSAVLATRGTMRLAADVVHEIALSDELLNDD